MPPCGVALKCPVSFVVGSCRLIIQSRLDPSPRIRGISNPSQSRPLLGQAPGLLPKNYSDGAYGVRVSCELLRVSLRVGSYGQLRQPLPQQALRAKR